jgi:hypothetical protein
MFGVLSAPIIRSTIKTADVVIGTVYAVNYKSIVLTSVPCHMSDSKLGVLDKYDIYLRSQSNDKNQCHCYSFAFV